MSQKKRKKDFNAAKPNNIASSFSNIEIVTLAVYILGGDSKYIDTEDVAIKVNEIAPGRFAWRKYPDQINIDNIGKRLSDGKNPKKGGYLLGSFKQGWILSKSGLKFSQARINDLEGMDLARVPLTRKEMVWKNREKTRMLASIAYEKYSSNKANSITPQDAEAFFRIDDYITGNARERRLTLITNSFGEDLDLGKAVKFLAKKVQKK